VAAGGVAAQRGAEATGEVIFSYVHSMTISVYTLLVFLHLSAAFLLVGGSVANQIILAVMRSSSNPGELLGVYRAFAICPRVILPSAALTALSGITIILHAGFPWLFWMVGAIVLLVILNIWRVLVVVPPTKVLQAAVAQAMVDPAAHGSALIAAARQPRLSLGHTGMDVIGVIIIALMIFKPSFS
jgi:hypothetical protein